MIIWGFKSYVRFLAIVTLVCGHCRNPSAQRVEEVVRKFTLFFIPLFATKRQNIMTCTFCGASVLIPKEQLDAVLAQAQTPQAGPTASDTPAGQGPAPTHGQVPPAS
jgi:hypothetical protein